MKLSTINYQLSTDQRGVTLLFSVFVMSGVAVITMTVGFFAIQELRAARATAQAEPAILAAESAAEAGLWQINRLDSWPAGCSSPENYRELSASQTRNLKCMTWGSALIEVVAGVAYTFHLYDPLDMNNNANPGFTQLLATYRSGSTALNIQVERLDGSLVATRTLAPGSQPLSITLPTNPAEDNRFQVSLTSSGNVTVDLNTNLGMPDFPTLTSDGWMEGGEVKRRLQVLVPR